MNLFYLLINYVACRCLYRRNHSDMAKPLIINVKESIQELVLEQKSTPKYFKRIQMIILFKKGMAASKDALAFELGVSNKSVQVWRKKYQEGGISQLLHDNRGIKGKITSDIHTAVATYIDTIKRKEDRRARVEDWLLKNHNIVIEREALVRYLHRHFGASRIRKYRKKPRT